MKSDIIKLAAISNKSSRLIIGLMSGTSLDGLDVALCRIHGSGIDTILDVENFTTIPYAESFKNEVRKVFARAVGDIELLTVLHVYIGRYHASIINQCLQEWGLNSAVIDLIASHGQTIYHAPQHFHGREGYGHSTLQIGDSDHIAVDTGIITIGDFRLKHIAGGGEGAPLAVYGDYLLFGDRKENRLLLNMGGIANFTWLPNDLNRKDTPMFSTDVGPGNTMMDAFVQRHYGMPYDVDGLLSRIGKFNVQLLRHLMDDPFFERSLPKTIGPELFNLTYLDKALRKMTSQPSHDDVLATLNRFTAEAIAQIIKSHVPTQDTIIYTSGGGSHNKQLLNNLSSLLPSIPIKDISSLGVSGDAKEAVLFAVLANECVSGAPIAYQGAPSLSMGKISMPN